MSDLGDVVAAYGAIVATFIGIRQWRHDRNPLVITLEPSYPDENPDISGDSGPVYLLVRVVNRSSEPITVSRLGIGYRVDYRRIRLEVLASYRSPINVVKAGAFKLGTSDGETGSVLQDEILGELDEDGFPPFRIDHVWAQDLAGRWFKGQVDPIYKALGYNSWNPEAPGLVTGAITARWWALCMATYRTRFLGSKGGPWIVNAFHRLHMFPIELASENEGAY